MSKRGSYIAKNAKKLIAKLSPKGQRKSGVSVRIASMGKRKRKRKK